MVNVEPAVQRLRFWRLADLAGALLLFPHLVVAVESDAVLPGKVGLEADLFSALLILKVPLLAVSLVAFDAMVEEAVLHPFVLIEKGGQFDLPASIALFLRTGCHHRLLDCRDGPLGTSHWLP